MYFIDNIKTKKKHGASLVILWLKFCASTVGNMGLTPDKGNNILYVMCCGKKYKRKPHIVISGNILVRLSLLTALSLYYLSLSFATSKDSH